MEARSNRDIILDTALALFAARGYQATGVQEIVAACGITKPTLYHYFGSKLGLLELIIARHGTPLEELIAAHTAYRHDVKEALERLAAAYFRFTEAHADFCRLMLTLYFAPPESEEFMAIAPLNERIFRRVESLFTAMAADHGNMRGRHTGFAASFIGMLNTYAGLHLAGHHTVTESTMLTAVKQFMHGIFS